jgi:hypothetical protein
LRGEKAIPPVSTPLARRTRTAAWLLLGLLVVLFVIDFYADVRGRDAFSWMDPYQYYYFAADLVQGHRSFNQFEIPSIFPFFILPFLTAGVAIPAALWVNVFFLIVLCLALHRLCRQLEITVPSALVGAAVLASPVLIGLSRELYIEFALTAFTAGVFALWLDEQRQPSLRRGILLGAAFGLGVMMKMTFPIFFIGPFLLVAISLARSRRYARLGQEVAAFGAPLVVVIALAYLVFPRSFTYYFSLGNTRIPIMKLIGPGGIFSAASILYYVSNIWKTMLLLLTPFLALALAWKPSRARLTDRTAVFLWAWLAGPLVLLTLEPVKEPRHVAPCVVPAVMLIFRGISGTRPARARHAVAALVLAVSLTQYGLVTRHAMDAPYFLDRPSRVSEITEIMRQADPGRQRFLESDGWFNKLRWIYSKNVVLQGFEPNMALLFAWQFHPAVVYDLDLLKEDHRQSREVAYGRFEDLYFLSVFNLYNRRCLWRDYYHTLDADTVLANADFVLASRERGSARGAPPPGFRSVGAIGTGAAEVRVLEATTPRGRSYRSIYAREFLRSGHALAPQDSATVYSDLSMNALLRGDFPEVKRLLTEYPIERGRAAGVRNIHWTGNDTQLKEMTGAAFRSYAAWLAREGRQPEN